MSPFEHGEVFVLDDGGEVRSLGGDRSSTFGRLSPNLTAIRCL
mgnify:CR=1 FL=1